MIDPSVLEHLTKNGSPAVLIGFDQYRVFIAAAAGEHVIPQPKARVKLDDNGNAMRNANGEPLLEGVPGEFATEEFLSGKLVRLGTPDWPQFAVEYPSSKLDGKGTPIKVQVFLDWKQVSEIHVVHESRILSPG